jgi:hypothetical protein
VKRSFDRPSAADGRWRLPCWFFGSSKTQLAGSNRNSITQNRGTHVRLRGSTQHHHAVKPVGSTGTGIDQLVSLITGTRAGPPDIDGRHLRRRGRRRWHERADRAGDRATGVANNGDISAADLYDVNACCGPIISAFTLLHGDDEDGQETGFHLVQNDGASMRLFERNAVNTVADGIYHLAFDIRDGQFLNEDGAANAKLTQVSQWLGQLLASELAGDALDNAAVDAYVDGTTGTGLDQLVSIITSDAGLNRKIANADIRGGASAADGMNALIVEAIRATGVANNGDISIADLRDLNTDLRSNHLTRWTQLHGDDAVRRDRIPSGPG